MSVIEKWALQSVVVVLFAWAAMLTSHWSSGVISATSTDRLATLSSVRLSSESVAVSDNQQAGGKEIGAGVMSGK